MHIKWTDIYYNKTDDSIIAKNWDGKTYLLTEGEPIGLPDQTIRFIGRIHRNLRLE